MDGVNSDNDTFVRFLICYSRGVAFKFSFLGSQAVESSPMTQSTTKLKIELHKELEEEKGVSESLKGTLLEMAKDDNIIRFVDNAGNVYDDAKFRLEQNLGFCHNVHLEQAIIEALQCCMHLISQRLYIDIHGVP